MGSRASARAHGYICRLAHSSSCSDIIPRAVLPGTGSLPRCLCIQSACRLLYIEAGSSHLCLSLLPLWSPGLLDRRLNANGPKLARHFLECSSLGASNYELSALLWLLVVLLSVRYLSSIFLRIQKGRSAPHHQHSDGRAYLRQPLFPARETLPASFLRA